MEKAFKITHHNRYGPSNTCTQYDEYSFVYTSNSWIGQNPGRNLYAHKKYVLDELRREIREDIDEYIKIYPAGPINDGLVSFGIFVFDHEISAMIKLTYW